jgi:hypothetical protein
MNSQSTVYRIVSIRNEKGKQNDGAEELACKEKVEEAFLLHFTSPDVISRDQDISKEYGGQHTQKYQRRVCVFQVVKIWLRDERAIRKRLIRWRERLDRGVIITMVVRNRDSSGEMDDDFVGGSRTASGRRQSSSHSRSLDR